MGQYLATPVTGNRAAIMSRCGGGWAGRLVRLKQAGGNQDPSLVARSGRLQPGARGRGQPEAWLPMQRRAALLPPDPLWGPRHCGPQLQAGALINWQWSPQCRQGPWSRCPSGRLSPLPEPPPPLPRPALQTRRR